MGGAAVAPRGRLNLPGGSGGRREFLASVGALGAAGLITPGRPSEPRGAASAPGDFLFAPGLVYLQTGSLGPTPRPVLDRTLAAWRELETNPVVYGYGAHEQAMEAVRVQAAAFLGCRTEELVLTNCTTEGMNWTAQGLGLSPGDRVVTTDQEHPGGRVCWDYLVRRQGVILDVVPVPPGENDPAAIVARFERALGPRTRVLSFSHLLSSTGLRMPVAELCALARRHGAVSVVDGAQAAGGIDVNVSALGCDVYATSGHKWLLAPKGTGLLYLNANLGSRVDPIALQSGRAAYSASSGVGNIPGVIGLGAALGYLDAIGRPRIETHNLALAARVYRGLGTVPKLEVVSPPPGPAASPLVTYRLPAAIPAGELYQRLLDRHRVVVKVVPGQWLNGHRISTHLFNTEADVDTLLTALRAELS